MEKKRVDMIGKLASLRQVKVLQVLLLVLFACGALYAGLLTYEMHKQLKKYEAMVVQFRQHQPDEAFTAQPGRGNINDQLEENRRLRNANLDVSLELQKKYQASAKKKTETNLQNKDQHRWLDHRREAMLQQQQEELQQRETKQHE